MQARVAILALALTGCGTTQNLPEPGPQDCQVRGGAALTEGTASASGIGGIQADVRGGAYTRVGQCGEKDFVFARTMNGFACHGTEEWCNNTRSRSENGARSRRP